MHCESFESNEPLDFALQLPTLKELCLLRISRSLWRTSEILKKFHPSRIQSIPKIRDEYLNNERTTEKQVLGQIQVLPLPEHMKKRINLVVQFVGRELFNWLQPYEEAIRLSDNSPWPNQIFQDYIFNDRILWTAYGMVDSNKVVQLLLSEDRIPIKDRYDLACKLCFESEIRHLWSEMDSDTSRAVMEGAKFDVFEITSYWSYKMTNTTWPYRNLNNVCTSAEEYLFEVALLRNYPTFGFLFKYFWPKLNSVQQERLGGKLKNRIRIASSNMFDALFYFLNSMGRQEQFEYLRAGPTEFLLKFLNRPWQHLFFPTLSATIDHINKNSFFSLLHCINMDQCDDYVRETFYSYIRPLVRKYIHNNDEGTLDIPITKNRLELVQEIMMDAPDAQKLDLIVRSFPREANLDKLETVKSLITDWVTSDTWVNLKTRLIGKFSPVTVTKFEDFFKYFDTFFADKRLV